MNKPYFNINLSFTTLNRLAPKLQAYCHAPGCEDFESCPQQCYCKSFGTAPKLGLDTAIAWEAEDRISQFLGYMGDIEYFIDAMVDYYRGYDMAMNENKDPKWAKTYAEDLEESILAIWDNYDEMLIEKLAVWNFERILNYHKSKYYKLHDLIHGAWYTMSNQTVKVKTFLEMKKVRKFYERS